MVMFVGFRVIEELIYRIFRNYSENLNFYFVVDFSFRRLRG